MVAPLPPPLGGSAKNSELMRQYLEAKGVDIACLSTSTKTLPHARSLGYHLSRMQISIITAWRLIRKLSKTKCTAYMVPDGGWGIVYFMLHYLIALTGAQKVILHHRSYGYIDKSTRMMKLVVHLGRKSVTHIFLSEGMANSFELRYGRVTKQICTNAVFIDNAFFKPSAPRRSAQLVVGHLSNLSKDKGFFIVADFFEELVARVPNAKLILAGPVQDRSVSQRLEKLKHDYGSQIEFKGAVYGADKINFYREIDVFLFPTCFSQEAQPNVVFESLAAGVPVMATPRGCIREMVGTDAGFVSTCESDFVTSAILFLTELISKQRIDKCFCRESIQKKTLLLKADSLKSLEVIADLLCLHD